MTGSVGARLNALLKEAGQEELPAETAVRFEAYLELLQRWNARTNLTAIRDEDGILRRHFVESIVCARALPSMKTVLDFGSGAGLPGIPIALCRPELVVTLAESQGKKAAFLREAGRVLQLGIRVHAGRAEVLATKFDCVVLRAVDRMLEAVGMAAGLVAVGGWLGLLTTEAEVGMLKAAAGRGIDWGAPVTMPGGDDRKLFLGSRLV
ncbi:MAG TPA: 16S rRNA (guanine(527)-N(7))-methyltransferase RsmG [Terracidiphilus sp.]|jgi:16S rRNA (guanine527-N7)-methyltransferase